MFRRRSPWFSGASIAVFVLALGNALVARANPSNAPALTMVPQLVHGVESHFAGIVSPDGKLAVSVHRGSVHLWDTESGALLRVHPATNAQPTIAFTPDGQWLRFSTSTHTGFQLYSWPLTSGETRQTPLDDVVLAFAPDGRLAFIRDWKSGGIQVRSVDEDKRIRTIAAHKAPRPAAMTHDPHQVASIFVAARGNVAFLERWDGSCEVWDYERGTLRYQKEHSRRTPTIAIARDGTRAVFAEPSETVKTAQLVVIDVAAGKEIKTIAIPVMPQALAMSPKGNRIFMAFGGKLQLWDVDKGTLVRTDSISTQEIRTFTFVDDETFLLGSSGHFEIRSASKGEVIRSFTDDKAVLGSQKDAAFTNADQHAFIVEYDGTNTMFRTWNTVRLGLEQSTRVHLGGDLVRISPDASRAWFKPGMTSATMLLWPSLEQHEFKMDWTTFQLRPNSAFTWGTESRSFVDAKRLRTDPDTKKPLAEYVIAELDGSSGKQTDRVVEPWPDHVEQMLTSASQDGKYAAARVFDTQSRIGSIKIWDVRQGKLERTLNLDSLTMPIAVFAPADHVAVAYLPKTQRNRWLVNVFDLRSGASVWSAPLDDGVANVMTYSKDGKKLAVAGTKIAVFDGASGKPLQVLSGDTEVVESLAFSADAHHIVTGGRSGVGTMHALDKQTNVHFIASGDDWLVYSDDGHFDASRRGGRLVAAVEGLHAYRIDQLAVRNNRPDVLLERIDTQGRSTDAIAHFRTRYIRRLTKLGIRSEAALPTFATTPVVKLDKLASEGNFATVSFDASARGTDLLRYNIFVNDVPLFGPLGKTITGRTFHGDERIELSSGRNKIEVSALDAAGGESLRAVREVEQKTQVTGDLYYLGFGVSKYKNPKFNLGYPHKDVLDLGEVLAAGAGKTFRQVHVRTYVNADATVDNIRRAKDFLNQAGVDDTVVLFIAGHGLHSPDASADYYFATYEIQPRRLSETAAQFDVVEDLLLGIRPRKKLFLMDTCESGEREETDAPSAGIPGQARKLVPRSPRALVLDMEQGQTAATPGASAPVVFDRERYIYNDLLRRSGAIVISSSRGSEFSYEFPEIANGVFTEEMLLALTSNRADRNSDGMVSTDELRAHLAKAVPERTNDEQHPTVDRDNLEANFAFPVVANVAAIVDRPESALPLPKDEPVVAPEKTPPTVTRPRACACEVVGEASNERLVIASIFLLLAAARHRQRVRRAERRTNSPGGFVGP